MEDLATETAETEQVAAVPEKKPVQKRTRAPRKKPDGKRTRQRAPKKPEAPVFVIPGDYKLPAEGTLEVDTSTVAVANIQTGPPKFDHHAEVSVSESAKPRGRFLHQGEHMFTYGEKNPKTGRYEPEPKYVLPRHIDESDLKTKVEQMIPELVKFNRQLAELLPNLTKFFEAG